VGATVWHVLSEPWHDGLMQRALAEIALLGIAGGALGCWVVLYNLSYSAESLAHGLLPGLVLASLAGLPLLLGGAVGLLVAAGAIALAARTPAIGGDTAVAVVVTTLFGLGVLLALAPATPAGLHGLLFGDPLGVSDGDLAMALGLVAVVTTALALLHGRLLIVGFDRTSAGAIGVASGRVDLALLGLIAVTLLVAVQGLGNLLVVALLVAPPTGARHLARRMPGMLVASPAIAVAAGMAGLYVSYYAHVAAGAAIAGALIASLVVVALLSGRSRRSATGSRAVRRSPASSAP
jgi:ABC-type Mn2+/Zn2+ transport system permease subunit